MALQSTTVIATITLQEDSNEVVFYGIPATYRDLILVIDAKANGNYGFLGRLNGDTGNNYYRVRLGGNGSSTYGSAEASNHFRLTSSTPTTDGMRIATIFDYSASDKHKPMLVRDDVAANNVAVMANRWASLNPVTSVSATVDLSGNFLAGATFSLYGRIA